MAVVENYLKSEDASLAASLLESEGIPATVVDESGFGGNLLGTSPGAIRVEVPASMLERAKAILAASEEGAGQNALESGFPPADTALQSAFRRLVVLEVVVWAIMVSSPRAFYHTPPPEVRFWLETLVPSRDRWETAALLHAGFTVMSLLAAVLLVAFIRIGRPLYLGTVAAGIALTCAYPPSIPTLSGNILGTIYWLLAGAIGGLMFVPEVSRRFKRHTGDAAGSAG